VTEDHTAEDPAPDNKTLQPEGGDPGPVEAKVREDLEALITAHPTPPHNFPAAAPPPAAAARGGTCEARERKADRRVDGQKGTPGTDVPPYLNRRRTDD